jgi:hypothetical protein
MVSEKIEGALHSDGVVVDIAEARRLRKLQKDLERVLTDLDAIVPARPRKAVPKSQAQVAYQPEIQTEDDEWDEIPF